MLLYQTAALVVFASRYEGFGLPVLEARRCGAPVICSNTSSLPEVLPDAEAMFDPHDVDAITAKLRLALTDTAFMSRLRTVADPGFSWAGTAEQLVSVYRDLGASTQRTHALPSASVRRSLGVVTVIPPTPSGIADHSDRLLTAIVDGCPDVDLTVFTDTPRGAPTPYRLAPLAALTTAWAASQLDAVVYVLGNNVFHRSSLQLLDVVPGHVLVHDLCLDGLLGADMASVVERWYDEQSVRPLGLRAVAASAISVLVQSAHAATLARDDLVAMDRPAAVVDIGPISCAPVSIRVPRPSADGPRWVVTAGIADARKQTDRFVAAARCSSSGSSWAVVGLGGDRFVGPGDGVVATGPLDDHDFFDWIDRAAVLVQLRGESQGESSGVVAHALARGVPTVVTDIGALAEIPDDVVVKVPVDISPPDLAGVIDDLLADTRSLEELSAAATRYALTETPLAQARRLVDAVLIG